MSYTLDDLSKLARDQLEAEKAVADAEQLVKDRKAALRKINEGLIPEAMDELQMEDFTTSEGIQVQVVTTIRASIPAKHKADAFGWLRENGHASLIKRTVSVVCRDDDQGNEILNKLDGYEVNDNPTVHPQTLGAFVREKLAEGEFIPQEELGVFRQRVSKVKVKA